MHGKYINLITEGEVKRIHRFDLSTLRASGATCYRIKNEYFFDQSEVVQKCNALIQGKADSNAKPAAAQNQAALEITSKVKKGFI